MPSASLSAAPAAGPKPGPKPGPATGSATGSASGPAASLTSSQVHTFRRRLMHWYYEHARKLPWRETTDPYQIWVSEVMLQQTRVNAVLEHYDRFLRLFPTVLSLALAHESDVLAAWSGLGYYRRARMLHRAARFLVSEYGGVIPQRAAELRTLPGIGDYTCAAIASIAYGESIAVVDGNVERVILRVLGRGEDPSAATGAAIKREAGALIPSRRSAANAPAASAAGAGRPINPAGDHNQAMMELGATVCLPRSPLCLSCPVYDLCRTRGEHVTLPRGKQKSHPAAYLLATRKRGTTTEVLLEKRDPEASLMPGMYELPQLPLHAMAGREPIMRLRHSITNTNYYVEIFAEAANRVRTLRKSVAASDEALCWESMAKLSTLPLTGLARKVLMRLDLAAVAGPQTPQRDL